MDETFRWLSPLGISTVLFLVMGALWIFVGTLTVPLHDPTPNATALFVTPRTDTAYFGAPPPELLAADPALIKLRTLLLTVLAGFLLLAGTSFIFLAWFGLRQGHGWALAALGAGSALAVVWWALALLPYVRAGVGLTLGDLPPFMWVPAALLLPAVALGWLGLG